MNIKKTKEQLINKKISIDTLTDEEVKKISESIKKDLTDKKEELNKLNHKIKNMKKTIDNWAN